MEKIDGMSSGRLVLRQDEQDDWPGEKLELRLNTVASSGNRGRRLGRLRWTARHHAAIAAIARSLRRSDGDGRRNGLRPHQQQAEQDGERMMHRKNLDDSAVLSS